MKVLMLNGSPHANGCTYTALSEVAKALAAEGIDTEIIQSGTGEIRDCIGCRKCRELNNRCVFDNDLVNQIIAKAETADGFIVGSPVYYAHPSGRILSLLNRIFYAGSAVFANKPGAAVVSARRAGTTASLDVLNKYFTISRMPIVSSRYWNMVHGNTPQEVLQDKEGMQIMRILGQNMAWLLKSIEAGKKAGITPPAPEAVTQTNFIR